MNINFSIIFGILVGFLFIDKAGGGGPFFTFLAGIACTTVCSAAYAACVGAGAGVEVALLTNPITAPFAGLLLPLFSSGCTAGYGACMTTCVGGSLAVPSP
jgi:hypothetical protein